jgi:hypothetical protein
MEMLAVWLAFAPIWNTSELLATVTVELVAAAAVLPLATLTAKFSPSAPPKLIWLFSPPGPAVAVTFTAAPPL